MRVYNLLALLPVLVNGLPSFESRDASSGSLLGSDGKATCPDFVANSKADWLIASLCAISKCNKDWPMAKTTVTDGSTDAASKVKVGIYDTQNNMNLNHETVKFADGSKDGSDNANGAWLGGAFDQAVIAAGGKGVKDGSLIWFDYPDNVDATLYGTLGIEGLSMLTGIDAVQETTPSNDDDFFTMLQHGTYTPMLIRTRSSSDALSQYYTVSTIYDDKTITLWDPLPAKSGTAVYSNHTLSTLRINTHAVYHLKDWQRFSQ